MDLSALSPVYQHEGPFATVYLEGRSPAEDAAEQLRLRWRGLRESIEADADARTLQALEEALATPRPGTTEADGRVLVATGGTVVLDEASDAALGAGDSVHWGQLPELGAYVREAARAVRELVVITDQHSAEVREVVLAEEHEPTEADAEEVHGSAGNAVHKPRGGAFSHKRIQRHADENLARNADEIADHVAQRADQFRPDVIVLAGGVDARAAVRQRLADRLVPLLVETDRGGKEAGASDEALTDELLRIADRVSTDRSARLGERFSEGLAHDLAVQGSDLVAKAATQGAVECLLFVRGRAPEGEAELLRDCARTDASAGLAPDDTQLRDDVGALLRFPVT